MYPCHTLYARVRVHAVYLENTGLSGLTVASQGLVSSEVVEGVVPGPALLAEVLEAADTATEERSRVPVAGVADTVLEIGLNLDLVGRV